MAAQIKFGTSGWRAIIAEEFTVANVRRAVGQKRVRRSVYVPDRLINLVTE